MKTVLYSVAPARSGSSLLGCLLGAHTRALHLGEVVAPLRKGLDFCCLSCLEKPCPLWGGVLREDEVRAACDAAASFRLGEQGDTSLAGKMYRQVFAAFPEMDLVVDSSKKIHWASFHAGASGGELQFKYLFLERDLRGCWASHKRGMPGEGAERLEKLKKQKRRREAFYSELPDEVRMGVRYEDLAVDLDGVLARIWDFVGLRFESGADAFCRYPQHVIGGNPAPVFQYHRHQGKDTSFLDKRWDPTLRSYYEALPSGFVLDERWREELSESELTLFSRMFPDSV